MIDLMFVTFHHHPIGLPDHVSSHSTVSSDLRRTSVKAKSIFGAVINPVLFHNKVSLALYLRLYPCTVVLQHPPAGSADVVQLRFGCVAGTESHASSIVPQGISNEFVATALRHHRSSPYK